MFGHLGKASSYLCPRRCPAEPTVTIQGIFERTMKRLGGGGVFVHQVLGTFGCGAVCNISFWLSSIFWTGQWSQNDISGIFYGLTRSMDMNVAGARAAFFPRIHRTATVLRQVAFDCRVGRRADRPTRFSPRAYWWLISSSGCQGAPPMSIA